MSGLYVGSQCDFEEMIEEAKKGRKGRIGKKTLYRLKLESCRLD